MAEDMLDVDIEHCISVRKWLKLARLLVKVHFHNENIDEVSVNDVYKLLQRLELEYPPEVGHTNHKQTICNIFRVPYYELAFKQVTANDKASKHRKIEVWKYIRSEDRRVPDGFDQTVDFLEDLGEF
jgi:hypothetical protein